MRTLPVACCLFLSAAACGGSTHPSPSTGAAPPAAAPEPVDPALAAIVDPIAAEVLAKVPASAMSVAVARDDQLLFAKGYGLADRDKNVAATAGTVYRIGSVTKQFTSAAVMQLVEQGKIGLDDPITKYLPDYPPPPQPITVRQLLTHSSGIHNYTDDDDFERSADQPITLAALIARFSGKPPEFPPGKRWSYSNSNYILLGAIIERVSGQPYADYLRDHEFGPVGLTATRYCDDVPTRPEDAVGYTVDKGAIAPSHSISMTTPYAAGALCSTAGDLVRWTAALHGHGVVSEASYATMTEPVTLTDGSHFGYGFGLFSDELQGHPRVHHAGGIFGFNSEVAYYPADRLAVVVLVSSDAGGAGEAAAKIARGVLGLAEPKVEELPLGADEAGHYTATYSFEAVKLTVVISYADGKLSAAATGQSSLRLLNQGGGRFVAEGHPEIVLIFHVGADGNADELTIEQAGMSIPGSRVK